MNKVKRIIIFLSLLLPYINFIFAQPAQETELSNITFRKIDNQIEVTIEYQGDIPYDSFSLMNPNRLVLDFLNIQKVLTPPIIEIDQMGIMSIRSAMNRPGVARVVFNFSEDIPQYQIEETEKGLKLLFWEGLKEEEKIPVKAAEKPEEKIEEVVKPPEKKEVKPKAEPKRVPETRKPSIPSEEKKMAFGFLSGFLAFQDEAFKEIYGEGGVFFRGEYSFLLPTGVEYFDVWTSVSHFEKSGKTSITEEDLKLRITSFSLALRYLRKMSRFTPFIGAGIDYIVYKEFLPEEFIIASVGGSDLGFHAQAGTYFDLLPSLALKIHIRYVFSKTLEDEVDVNLGGPEYGLGLVFRFNL